MSLYWCRCVSRACLCFFLFVPCVIWSNPTLKTNDVRTTFDEMLDFHVEHASLSPLLMQRAQKIYLEQFDSSKMYLLEDEVKGIESLSEKKIEKGIERYKKNDLTDFIALNVLVEKAVERSRRWREEMQKELILSTEGLQPVHGETYLSYAKNRQQLRNRVRKQLIRILSKEKEESTQQAWTPMKREKIFSFWESRFNRSEERYLSSNKIGEHQLAYHTLKALAKSLDAHTAYFSPEEALEMRISLNKEFYGVGIALKETIDGVMISNLIPGGPAEKSGQVEIGDQIIEINGKSVKEMSYSEILISLKGDGKSGLTLKLLSRESGKQKEVFLKQEKIELLEERLQYTSHPYGDGHIGVLTLSSFYEGESAASAEADMREALKSLKKAGPLKGVILDMRENAGGFLSQAVKVAGLFITRGVVVISKYSDGEIKYLRNLDGTLHFDGPLIVLTSKASASAAEIVAQALQDYGAALIVGDPHTYGKGTIQYQTVTDPQARVFYKVTVGRYYTVSGRSTQIEGVQADIVVPTIFSPYKIGERFLDYPLTSDTVAAAYVDPLTDVDFRNRIWFQKNYLPNLHQPQDRWQRALPTLRANSERRIEKDKNFSLFLKQQGERKRRSPRSFQRICNPAWGHEDLQVVEAINIMKDLILCQKDSA